MKKKIVGIALILVFAAAAFALTIYMRVYSENVKEDAFVMIPTGSDFEAVQELLEPHLLNLSSFAWVAEKKNYPNVIRSGKFKIEAGMNNNELVNHLRGGKQETITLVFNNQDKLEKLAGRVAAQIEPDSISLLTQLKDSSFLTENGFQNATAIAMYLPNSYEFYWNSSAEDFQARMLKEYQRFWNAERKAKAKAQGLSPQQVITLASIVQKETAVVAERPKVAGLYLNRLKDFWPLQADPTIIFALKEKYGEDKEFKRVLNKDLTIDSPYNTYANFGLPPGPIGMPDISSIEAVLNPEKHSYYYMCAEAGNIGTHKFAKTLAEHNKNAREYQRWISQQGINR